MISHSYVSLLEVTAKFTSRSFWSESDPNAGQYAICFWNIPAMSRSCMFPLKNFQSYGISWDFPYYHGFPICSYVFPCFSYVFPMVFRKSPPFVCYLPPPGFTPRRLVVSDANVTLVNVQAEALQEFIGRCMEQCICISIYIYMQGGAPQVMFVGL